MEDPLKLPDVKRVLMIIRTGLGAQQIWGMVKEVNNSYKITPSLAIIDNAEIKKHKFCSMRAPVFVHSFLYRALKLTYLWDIGSIPQDDSIKTNMGQGSMEEAVGLLSTTIFQPNSQS